MSCMEWLCCWLKGTSCLSGTSAWLTWSTSSPIAGMCPSVGGEETNITYHSLTFLLLTWSTSSLIVGMCSCVGGEQTDTSYHSLTFL